MNEIIDPEKMKTALKRAADAAVHGGSEDRRGQMSTSLREIAERIRNEVNIATINWCTVEALNNDIERIEARLTKSGGWQAAIFASRALVRDVIASLMRVTDGKGDKGDLHNLCGFIARLEGRDFEEIASATGATVAHVELGLAYLRDRVPRDWAERTPRPSNDELARLRDVFWPIRNALLAHATDYTQLDLKKDMPKMREFLRVSSSLADAACLVANVQRAELQERWNDYLREGRVFWGAVMWEPSDS